MINVGVTRRYREININHTEHNDTFFPRRRRSNEDGIYNLTSMDTFRM
jgi:hypothetical protein